MTLIYQHMLESLKQETGSEKENNGFEIFSPLQLWRKHNIMSMSVCIKLTQENKQALVI